MVARVSSSAPGRGADEPRPEKARRVAKSASFMVADG